MHFSHYFYQLSGEYVTVSTPSRGWFKATRHTQYEDVLIGRNYYPSSQGKPSGVSPKRTRKRIILTQSMIIDVDPGKVGLAPFEVPYLVLTRIMFYRKVTRPSLLFCTMTSYRTRGQSSISSFNGLGPPLGASRTHSDNGAGRLRDTDSSSWRHT